MNSIVKNAARQAGGLAKHALGKMVQEPAEVLKQATGLKSQDRNDAMADLEVGAGQVNNQQQSNNNGNGFSGFKTQQDFDKYTELSGKKDEIELNMLRRKLHNEFGVSTDLESGMQKIRMERKKKKEQVDQVEEQQEEREKLIIDEQKKENLQVQAAKAGAGAETSVGKKMAG